MKELIAQDSKLKKIVLLHHHMIKGVFTHWETFNIGDLTFSPSNGDRLIMPNGKSLMGLRSQYDYILKPGELLCMVESRDFSQEKGLFKDALIQARSSNPADKKVFLLEIKKPLLASLTTVFAGDITHMPFVPGSSDLFKPFENDDSVYVGSHRYVDLREPNITLCFAHKSNLKIHKEIQPESPVSSLYEMKGKPPDVEEIYRGSISHLAPFSPGRGDLFRPFKLKESKSFTGDHRQYSVDIPNLVKCYCLGSTIEGETLRVPLNEVDPSAE